MPTPRTSPREDGTPGFAGPLPVPAEARHLPGFRRWAASDRFPSTGRVDFLAGHLEVDMSPEDLYTHGAVKAEIAAELQILIARPGRGSVFVDRARVTCPKAGLSAEPDVVVALWASIDAGRLREVPAAGRGAGRFIELEGAPDLVVEVVSDSSERKDGERLPPLYAAAGVPELWRVDARGDDLRFEVFILAPPGRTAYQAMPCGPEGWTSSPLLGRRLRLLRRRVHPSRWTYRLEHAAP